MCKDCGAQHGLEIEFSSENIPRSVEADIALYLLRIVQEELRNLKKHSGVSKGTVHLSRVGDQLQVSVRDQGIGFDAEALNGRQGLAIRSMEEQATLWGGCEEMKRNRGMGAASLRIRTHEWPRAANR